MTPFKKVCSQATPLAVKDIDTDQIYPAQYLTSISRQGCGKNLFRGLKEKQPDFILNRVEFRDSEILVADSNFGCGSSREHAVWSIVDAGFKVVISKSFADIFSSNSAKNGLLLVELGPDTVDSILKESQSGNYRLTVDLESQTVTLPNGDSESFDYDPFRKHCLLNGLDDIDYIRSRANKITEFFKSRRERAFFAERIILEK